jgi:hypothetical protein
MKSDELSPSDKDTKTEEDEAPNMFTPLDDEDIFDSVEEMEAFVDSLLAKYPDEDSFDNKIVTFH